jgi:hypothetical protein
LDRRISLAGALISLGYLAQTVASYWLGPAQVVIEQTEAEWSFYPTLTGLESPAWLTGNLKFLSLYCVPLLAVTFLCAYILISIYRGGEPKEKISQDIFRWSILFAVINIAALPVQTQDFWLSIAFGKELLSGLNPYYDQMPQWIGEAWHPDSFRPKSCYGPLWILVSSAAALLSENRWVLFGVFKLLLGACWLATLFLIRKFTRTSTSRERCAALLMFGWLPLSVNQILGEGHNDIVMTMLVMLWLYSRNTFALASAAVMKYTAAPLGLFVLLDRRKPLEIALAALIGIGLFALFYRGEGFLACNTHMLDWHFMTPREALAFLGRGAAVGFVPFVVLAGYWTYTYYRTRDTLARTKAVIATIALLLFCAYPLIWPWYLIALLAPAALLPLWSMSIWVTGFALVAPFSMLYHFRGNPRDWMAPWPALIVYALAIGWWLVVLAIRGRRQIEGAASKPG